MTAILRAFIVDFRRCFGKRICFNWSSVFGIFVVPLIVAIMITLAFLDRDQMFRERFTFFSTLYGFWVGLFASCQAINGAVADGEWSYWVLGLRRKTWIYLLSVMVAVAIISFLQLIVFFLTIIIIDGVFLKWTMMNLASAIQSDLIEMATPFIYGFFSLGIFSAALSGVALGTFLSCVCPDPLTSIRLAVAIIVVVTVCSTTVLRKEESTDPTFLPVKLKFLKRNGCNKPSYVNQYKGGIYLENISFVFPQRYFFNIGRSMDSDITKMYDNDDCIRKSIDYVGNSYIPERIIGEDRCNFKIYINFIREVALWELSLLMFWSFSCTLLSYLFVRYSQRFYELR